MSRSSLAGCKDVERDFGQQGIFERKEVLRVELKVNGRLIDSIKIINTASFGEDRAVYVFTYKHKKYSCAHHRPDGAWALAYKAIKEIINKE